MAGREPVFFSKQVTTAQRFYRTLKRDETVNFSVCAGGKETCPPGYTIHRTNFPYYGIEFVLSGKGILKLKESTHVLHPGTIFCYGPGIEHTIENNQLKTDLVKYFVDIRGKSILSILNEVHILGKVVYTASPQSIMNSFEDLSVFGLTDTKFSEVLCASLGRTLIYKIAQTAIPYEASFSTFTRCKLRIDSSYLQLHSLQEISHHCEINASYLCRLFKRYKQQSPYQYLLRLQMNHAADLLMIKGYQVKEAALALSYEDQFHFSRTFKRVMGQPPTTFIERRRS